MGHGFGLDLSWETAIISGGVLFAAGLGFEAFGKFFGRRQESKTGRFLSWPCRLLTYVSMGAAVLIMLWALVVLWTLREV